MKKLLLLLFALGLMACGQKQEVTEEAPAVEETATEEAEAIHVYLIEWAWLTYEKEQGPSKPHQPKE